MINQLKTLSDKYFKDTIAIRRHIHKYPELSGQEYKTAEFIAKTLKNYGIEPKMYLNNTAVIAVIEGKKTSNKVLALRVDTDALPIEENNDLSFCSVNKGVMHACGHDVHTASLLTTARILQELKEEWEGTVKLIFQPSEEQLPGGAIQLIEAGVLENPKVDAILGMHVSPGIKTGQIGIKSGDYMASSDEIYITVTGKGGHAAIPKAFINPLLIAAKILSQLDTVHSEQMLENKPSVLTFGRIIGEGKTNIVPNEVFLEGTLRTFDEAWREKMHQIITENANSIAKEMGGNAQVRIEKSYPVLTNDEALTSKVFQIAQDFLGEDNVISLDYRMTAEDFAYYARCIPAVFYRLGTEVEGYKNNSHSPEFRVNEESMKMSPALMAGLVVSS